MPNRIFREGWLESPAVNQLEPDTERFFLRLIIAADDAGRIDGRPEVVRAKLFPLKDDVTIYSVAEWINECCNWGLVYRYAWKGQPYLQIARTQRYGKTLYSKVPWLDGSHEITYDKIETRDGRKEFVRTSLPAAGLTAITRFGQVLEPGEHGVRPSCFDSLPKPHLSALLERADSRQSVPPS